MFMRTIVGIVLISLFVLTAIAVAIALFSDFLRYMKIRSSLRKGQQFTRRMPSPPLHSRFLRLRITFAALRNCNRSGPNISLTASGS